VRTNSSRVSHVGIDDAGEAGVFFLTAAFSFVAGTRPVVLGEPEGCVAFSLLHTS